MLRVYHLFLGVILLAITPVGIKTILPRFSPAVVKTPSPEATTTHTSSAQTIPFTTPNSRQENTWKQILGKTPTPNGWEVVPCEGNDPLLCVSSQGKVLGKVEIGVYPVKNNPNFQKNLTDAGIPLDSQVNYQSPEYQDKLLTALNAWVTDLNATFLRERQNTYKNEIVFSAYPPQQASVGKLQGIRYGFVGIKPEGEVQEQHLSHVAFDGKALYIITTAFGSDSLTGKFEQLENLAIFQPYFLAIAANLKLPI